jgi:hypothetical protein
MLRQTLVFLLFLFLLSTTFVIGERSFSPTFQDCISSEENAERQGSTEKQPPGFGRTAVVYVTCTGTLIDTRSAGITAIATIVIAAFTGTLWTATSRQGLLTREALIADKRAFVFPVSISPNWDREAAGNYCWRFRPDWHNSGDTPTKRLTIYTDCELRNTPLPTGYDFTRTAVPPGTGLLAPKNTLSGGAAPHPPGAAMMFRRPESSSICGDGRAILMSSPTRPHISLGSAGG